VTEAGEAATDRVGRRVLVGPVQPCGECDVCRRGRVSVCPNRTRRGVELDGALGGQMVARSRWLCDLEGLGAPEGPEAAALAREAPLAYEMFARAGVAPGETTIWIGGGPIARFGLEIARAKGAVAFASEPGAGAARPFRIFETSGRDDARLRAVSLADDGAIVTMLSGEATGAGDAAPLPLAAALDREVVLVGVSGAHPDLLPECAALVARGELDVAGAVDLVPAARYADAIAAARGGGSGRLTVVTFG
jgi:threonine dehydrogenase-like Zn-dependent dehydrogenase